MSGPTIQNRRQAAVRNHASAPRARLTAAVRRIGFSFSGKPVEAARARHWMEALLAAQWGQSPGVDDAALVAAEVLANGCRHGGGRVRVRARISSRSITLNVSTPAPWRAPAPTPAAPGAIEEGGHGLEIVAALAESVRIGPGVDGSGVSVTVVCLATPARPARTSPAGA